MLNGRGGGRRGDGGMGGWGPRPRPRLQKKCIAPKKIPDKAMSIWNLHKKFQLSSAMGLRDFDLQSQPTLMGGNPLIVVQWSLVTEIDP